MSSRIDKYVFSSECPLFLLRSLRTHLTLIRIAPEQIVATARVLLAVGCAATIVGGEGDVATARGNQGATKVALHSQAVGVR